MIYYILYDPQTGMVIGFAQGSTGQTAPANSVVVDQTTYDELVSAGGYGWLVNNGSLVAPTASSELLYDKQSKKNEISRACQQTIYAGFPIAFAGAKYTITLREDEANHDQTNNLSNLIMAQQANASAGKWGAGVSMPPNTAIKGSNGFYVTFDGGITGSAQPAFPTEPTIGVVDGTVTWYLFSFRVSTTSGTIFIDPISAIGIGAQGFAFINAQRAKYDQLKAKIASATDSTSVKAISW